MKLINLETKNTTYQIGVNDKGFVFHLYYGVKNSGDMSSLLTYYFRGGHGMPNDYGEDRTFSPDALPMEFSCMGSGDYRKQSFVVSTPDGAAGCDLRYKDHRFTEGKYAIEGLPASYADADSDVKTLEVELYDERLDLTVVLMYGVFYNEDIITRTVRVVNGSRTDLYLNRVMSASMDFVTDDYDMLHFSGRHFNEMDLERVQIQNANYEIGSRRGVSSHQHNPFAILAKRDAAEDHGACYAMQLVYSGNFVIRAEADQYNCVRFQGGLSDELLNYSLKKGEIFNAPEAVMSFSDEGFTKLSQSLHGFIREHICRGPYKYKRRPILVNNWEATYFDFTGDKLIEIAKVAADLGIEMFVLDDGWFGNRGPDDRGLGDWFVNEEKMGGPLSNIVDKINALGLKFGLWIEPEMVNENSVLYREHPDYALTIPGKPPVRGRSQLVLDFTRKDVRDCVFDQIVKVIDSANIEYIKMDMNRSISEAFSACAENQNFGEICHKYVLGVYEFIERLLNRYPKMLVEGCSSGGARFDAGLMYYTPQIWTSDNSDAIERLKVQFGASFGYPVSVVGSHISAVPNHQNGRITDIDTRAIVAMMGNFGYELDLTKLSDDDKAKIKHQIVMFKKYRDLIHEGLYYRMTDYGRRSEYYTTNVVARDGAEALMSIVTTNTHGNPIIIYGKCRGLEDAAMYKVYDAWNDSAADAAFVSGATLRTVGIPLPMASGEYQAYLYKVERQ